MNVSEAIQLISHLMGCYRQRHDQNSVMAYVTYMLHFPREAAERAIIALPTKSKFFPTVEELLREIKSELPKPDEVMRIEAVAECRRRLTDDEILQGKTSGSGMTQVGWSAAILQIMRERGELKLTEAEQFRLNFQKVTEAAALLKEKQERLLSPETRGSIPKSSLERPPDNPQ